MNIMLVSESVSAGKGDYASHKKEVTGNSVSRLKIGLNEKVEKADSNSKYYLIGNFKNDLDLEPVFFHLDQVGSSFELSSKSVTGPMKACKYSEIRLILCKI